MVAAIGIGGEYVLIGAALLCFAISAVAYGGGKRRR